MAITLSQDSEGWTIFTPTADSRIMYVSNEGNDATGTIYDYDDFPDPFNPGSVNAFETYSGARANSRNGYPDWILFERGGTFETNLDVRPGKDADEFSITGWYGASGTIPLIKTGSGNAISLFGGTRDYSAVVGLYFYATRRDPDHDDYINGSGTTGIDCYIGSEESANQVLIEGCVFRFFIGNEILHDSGGGTLNDFVFRRCSFLDNYNESTTYDDATKKSQGLYMQSIRDSGGITLEECIFDHNGWYNVAPGLPGCATMFNHNVYISTCDNITFTKNIFSRASSQNNKFTSATSPAGAKDIIIDGNLYLDGLMGIGIGGNATTALRFQNVIITDNVLTEIGRSNPTGEGLCWPIICKDWDGGEISGNLLAHFNTAAATNIFGIYLESGGEDVDITDNIVYGINAAHSPTIYGVSLRISPNGNSKTNFVVSGNKLQEISGNNGRTIYIGEDAELAEITFSDNEYYSNNESTSFDVEGTPESFGDWVTRTSDTSSFITSSFSAPTRSIETYMQSLGQTATIDAFITKIRAINRFNWDTDYTAEVINTWIRAGFFAAAETGGDFSTSIKMRF